MIDEVENYEKQCSENRPKLETKICENYVAEAKNALNEWDNMTKKLIINQELWGQVLSKSNERI